MISDHKAKPDAVTTGAVDTPEEPASKRRKITADDKTGRSLSKSDQIREQLATARRSEHEKQKHSHSSEVLPSLSKPVTPPPTNGKKSTNNKLLERLDANDNSIATKPNTKSVDSGAKGELEPSTYSQ